MLKLVLLLVLLLVECELAAVTNVLTVVALEVLTEVVLAVARLVVLLVLWEVDLLTAGTNVFQLVVQLVETLVFL